MTVGCRYMELRGSAEQWSAEVFKGFDSLPGVEAVEVIDARGEHNAGRRVYDFTAMRKPAESIQKRRPEVRVRMRDPEGGCWVWRDRRSPGGFRRVHGVHS